MGLIVAFGEHYLIDVHPNVSSGRRAEHADDVTASRHQQQHSSASAGDASTTGLPHVIRRLGRHPHQPNAGVKAGSYSVYILSTYKYCVLEIETAGTCTCTGVLYILANQLSSLSLVTLPRM